MRIKTPPECSDANRCLSPVGSRRLLGALYYVGVEYEDTRSYQEIVASLPPEHRGKDVETFCWGVPREATERPQFDHTPITSRTSTPIETEQTSVTARTETENLPERRDSNKSQNTLTEWEITTLARGKARGGAVEAALHRHKSVPGARQLHRCAVAPVVALQAQGQATQGRDVSTLAPLRVLRARAPVPAWARRAVGEGVKSCPRAGCGKSSCPVAH